MSSVDLTPERSCRIAEPHSLAFGQPARSSRTPSKIFCGHQSPPIVKLSLPKWLLLRREADAYFSICLSGFLAPIGGSSTSARPLWTRGWSTNLALTAFSLRRPVIVGNHPSVKVFFVFFFILGGGPQGHEAWTKAHLKSKIPKFQIEPNRLAEKSSKYDECAAGAVCLLRLHAIALALRGPRVFRWF